jgi:hypothetical protein
MTSESKNTGVCDHRWKVVEGSKDLVVCDKCNAAKRITIQRNENRGPSKPLLME